MTSTNELVKMKDFEVVFRTPYEGIENLVVVANQLILDGSICNLEYDKKKRLLRIKIYRQRQNYSCFSFSGTLKDVPNDFESLIILCNFVVAYGGFIQFNVKNNDVIKSSSHEKRGPILQFNIFEPKCDSKLKILKQTLSSINIKIDT